MMFKSNIYVAYTLLASVSYVEVSSARGLGNQNQASKLEQKNKTLAGAGRVAVQPKPKPKPKPVLAKPFAPIQPKIIEPGVDCLAIGGCNPINHPRPIEPVSGILRSFDLNVKSVGDRYMTGIAHKIQSAEFSESSNGIGSVNEMTKENDKKKREVNVDVASNQICVGLAAQALASAGELVLSLQTRSVYFSHLSSANDEVPEEIKVRTSDDYFGEVVSCVLRRR